MRILVTGARGFIGRHLVRDLLQDGNEVVALDRQAGRDGDCEGARQIVGDVGDVTLVQGALRGCELVYHLAAAHLDQSTPEEEYRRVNVGAAGDLLRAASAAGVPRFVHCSTVGVYGHVEHPPIAEDGPAHPGNLYETTKLEGEREILRVAAALHASVVLVRPAWVYGPGCPRTQRLLRMIFRRRFFYFGSGRNLRHPVYISDLCAGLRLAAERGRPGRVYNLAGPEARPLKDVVETAARVLEVPSPRLHLPMIAGVLGGTLAEALFGALGKSPPISRRSLAFFRNVNAYSIELARSHLGYEPRVSLEEGFQLTVQALRSASHGSTSG